MTENKVGMLRGQVALQVHTKQSVRLWYGRKANKEKNLHGILGLQQFLYITNNINEGSRSGDPYSDWYMLRVERKIERTKARLTKLNDSIDSIIKELPSALIFTEIMSIEPAQFPVVSYSHLGYQAVYILAQYDEIARKTVQVLRFGLIDRTISNRLFQEGDHALRSLFTFVQRYRYSGITRVDLAQHNAAAIAAIAKLGKLPPAIISGQWRSRFSPPLRENIESKLDDDVESDEDDDELLISVSLEDKAQEIP